MIVKIYTFSTNAYKKKDALFISTGLLLPFLLLEERTILWYADIHIVFAAFFGFDGINRVLEPLLFCYLCVVEIIVNSSLLYFYIAYTFFCIFTNSTSSLLNIIPFYVFLFICLSLILMKKSQKFFKTNIYSLDNLRSGIRLDPLKKCINTFFSLLFLGYSFNVLCAPENRKRFRDSGDDERASKQNQKKDSGDKEYSSGSTEGSEDST